MATACGSIFSRGAKADFAAAKSPDSRWSAKCVRCAAASVGKSAALRMALTPDSENPAVQI